SLPAVASHLGLAGKSPEIQAPSVPASVFRRLVYYHPHRALCWLSKVTVQPATKPNSALQRESALVRSGLALARWSERWFPDPLVFALLGITLVFLFGIILGEKPAKLAIQGGKSFWSLVPFTMQMVMIIIGGYVVASAPL